MAQATARTARTGTERTKPEPAPIEISDQAAKVILHGGSELWWAMLIEGVIAVFFGLAAIFWPGLTLTTLIYLFGGFVMVWGIIETISGVLAIRRRDTWWLTLVFGIVGLGVGVFLVRHPTATFATFILVTSLTLLARGLFDLVGAFLDRTPGTNRILNALVGVAAIAAGIILLLQPAAGGVAFVWILGLYAIIYGGMSIAVAVEARDAWHELQKNEP